MKYVCAALAAFALTSACTQHTAKTPADEAAPTPPAEWSAAEAPAESPAPSVASFWRNASGANVARALFTGADGAAVRLSCLGAGRIVRIEAVYPALVETIPGDARAILSFDGGAQFSTLAMQAREKPYRLIGDFPANAEIVTAFMNGARVEIALSHAEAGSSSAIELDGAVHQFATECAQITGQRGGR